MADSGAAVAGRFLDSRPRVSPSAFIAPGASLVGDVVVGDEASVLYGAVLRGDINRIVIGPRSNIQDGSVVHLADDLPCLVGELVTCGHRAVLHACTVADEVLVGMGAIVMDGAAVGPRSVIGAGSLVTMGMQVPEGSLVLGSPARVVRRLDAEEQRSVRTWAEKYVALSRRYIELASVSARGNPAP